MSAQSTLGARASMYVCSHISQAYRYYLFQGHVLLWRAQSPWPLSTRSWPSMPHHDWVGLGRATSGGPADQKHN